MDKIEFRKIGSLRLHQDNVAIFGPPTEEPNYEEIREDIRKRGLQEPLIILNDGTILSGHIRYAGVCWSLEQDGLSRADILEKLIPVRVHEDFDSKEEELEYLMAANEKRRQLDPRRIATSYERLVQVIESSMGGKKGKKGEALQGLADRLGTSHKLAKSYSTIFSSRVVPDEVKEKVNSKVLSPSAVLEAIKFAEDSAKREARAPSMADVDAYIKTPRAKTSLADTLRKAAQSTVATSTGAPTPKPTSKPTTVEVVPEPAQAVTQKPVADPEPVVIKPSNEPNVKGTQKQEGPCEVSKGDSDGSGCNDHPDSNPVEKVIASRRLLKEALGVIILDPTSTSELLGLHTELTSYLLAMGIIRPSVELPTTTLAQLELCTSLIQGIGDNVQDPQGTRDALLDLVNSSRVHIERLSTAKHALEPNGLYCPECLTQQYISTSGAVCEKGHGGLEGITESQATAIRTSQDLTDSKYECAQCGSMVETSSGATHASCPKCGLVDTADIESVSEALPPGPTPSQSPPKGDEVLSAEDLAALLEPESQKIPTGDTKAPPPSIKIDPPSPSAKEGPKEALQPTTGKAKPEKPTQDVQVSAPSPSTGDPDVDLVSSVIDDFMGEIQEAGGIITP